MERAMMSAAACMALSIGNGARRPACNCSHLARCQPHNPFAPRGIAQRHSFWRGYTNNFPTSYYNVAILPWGHSFASHFISISR